MSSYLTRVRQLTRSADKATGALTHTTPRGSPRACKPSLNRNLDTSSRPSPEQASDDELPGPEDGAPDRDCSTTALDQKAHRASPYPSTSSPSLPLRRASPEAFTDLQRLLEAVRNQARDVAIGIAGFEAAPGVRGTADAALGEAMELAARVRRWLARAERSRVGSEAWAATLGEAWGGLGSQAEAVDAASARLARLCYAQGQHSPLHLLALQLDFRGLQDPDGIPPV